MKKIALIPIKGMIVAERAPMSTSRRTASSDIVPLLDAIKHDKATRAVVLEVNSPGGSPFPCQEIVEAIRALGKPSVTWVKELSASGAYWISSATDVIVASPMSSLGSVGAISIRPDLSGLIKSLGIDVSAVASGAHKRYGFPFVPLSEDEKREDVQRREEQIAIIQKSFLQEVCRARHLDEQAERKVATGDVYLGEEARALGLIDEFGGKEKAFEIAARNAGVRRYKIADYTRKLERPRKSLLARLLDELF